MEKIEPRCYFIMNKGLEMPVGKLAVQVGHGMDKVYEALENASHHVKTPYVEASSTSTAMTSNFSQWKEAGRKKVLLSTKNDEELQKYSDKLSSAGYVVLDIVDNGINFFDGPTRTGLVVFPILNAIPELKRLQVYK